MNKKSWITVLLDDTVSDKKIMELVQKSHEFSEKKNKKGEIIMAVVYMTDEGYHKMMDEINYLESVKRPEISRQIAEARDKGDLSENAEYDAAKEAQGLLEMKIAQLKAQVANARIINDANLNTHTVQMLNRVKIKNCSNGAVMEYMLVTESEANLAEHKISVTTPIAKGLLGKKVGDIVEIKVPSGLVKFEIVDIMI